MVLIDTSIWISLYRKENVEQGQRMWALVADNQAALCGQVWVEFLGGFRKRDLRLQYEKNLREFPFLETSREAFELASHLLAEHPQLGAGDAIIAATAITNSVSLWTTDKDFRGLTSSGLDLHF